MAGHPNPSPSPHARNPISATDPNAPFIKAVSAIFALPDRSWDADLRDTPDEYWKISPAEMLQTLKTMTYRDFPDFDAQRTQHIQDSVKKQDTLNKKSTQTSNNKTTFKAPVFDATDKEVIIIKDIRFENEAHFIRTLNGEIWHIIRDNVESVKTHSSEAGIKVKPEDTIIHNNGTLENYTSALEQAWATLQTKLTAEKQRDGILETNGKAADTDTRI